ncbi:MAG: RHS repeat-associated core domain-containing protein [Bacteroidota bacterium]
MQRTPYRFTSKELDEETGLYYFGARYYDPRTSVWQSPDPILGEYLPNMPKIEQKLNRSKNSGGSDSGMQLPVLSKWKPEQDLSGMGGVYNTHNLGLYSYARNNPVIYKDPDGNELVISENMKPIVDKLIAKSETARSILEELDKDPRKFHIQRGNDPSGGSATPVRGRQTSLFERMLGEKDGPDSMLITVNTDPESHSGFVDSKGKLFNSSNERILGHELGHALIWAEDGYLPFTSNQVGAVDVENAIAKELDHNAPVRHRTKGHGRRFQ